ncbi:MAG: T9SS type A sorting domain-containing protein [Ignavibacteriaceae bacterium]
MNQGENITSYFVGCYPNPFNPSTIINYQLPEAGIVSLRIYDTMGRGVKTLVNELKAKGSYNISFDASHLSSGVYFYQLRAGDFVSIKKMVLLK